MFLFLGKRWGNLKRIVEQLTDKETDSIDLKILFAVLIGEDYEEHIEKEKAKDTIID
jgi:hypothetical protein